MNNYEWFAQVLLEGRFPILPVSVQNGVRWMAAENPPQRWYHKDNPLNVADFTTDSHSFSTLESAAVATAKVIRQSNMSAIAYALEGGAGLDLFSKACAASPWSTGGYHGRSGFIASIPLPPVVEAPGTPPISTPYPQPPAQPVQAEPTKEEAMQATYIAPSSGYPTGLLVTVGVSPAGHPLVFTSTDYGRSWSVSDVVDAIKDADPTDPVNQGAGYVVTAGS